ncbi:MAG: hypothetical protein QY322_02275 [bacterium]|nr:MAG: hypothetical protein QY322_02275 [bacterium]
MTTLTEASIGSRKAIRYGIYAIISIIIARSLLLGAISLYKTIFPPPPEPPTVAFGRLTKLPLPNLPKLNLTFTLETAEGGIPQFPLKTNVYFMPKNISNLLALDISQDKVNRLGFNIEPQQASDTTFKFYHKTAPSSLEMDIVNGTFSLNYDLNADPTPLSFRPSQPEIARNSIKTFLASASLYPPDLEGGIFKHTYLKTQSGGFTPALSLSDANLVRLDLFRKSYDNLPTATKNPNEGNVWFLISGVRERGKEVLAGEYHYFPVDETQSATYPIKSGEVAWQEFVGGNYFIASNGTAQEGENIKIREIYLAYYDPGTYTEFFQPVFVFEGDKDFVAYIPAVTQDYYGE